MPAVKSVTQDSLLRAPGGMNAFEHKIDNGTRVQYIMIPGATTLSFVYAKLAGKFYDVPGIRLGYICADEFRTRKDIANVANLIAGKLGLDVSPEVNHEHVYNDEGLPDDLRKVVQELTSLNS